jgi:hydrogenase 3 maturation protease
MGPDRRLLDQLANLRGSKTLIIGIGNILKGDDAVGPLICKKLQKANVSAEIIDAGTVPENYIQPIVKKAPNKLVIIDAVDFAAPPGKIEIFSPLRLSSVAFSTHALSPRLFIDMITAQIDLDVYFLAIQPAQTALGKSVTPPISQAVELTTNLLIEIFPPPT